jgi:mono/diheme cytochrome c family protein
MTHVRQFYVDNLLGNLDGTLGVANSEMGGTYPPGSVIQLVPGEAMVKRDKGFNPVTHDWEFFELDVSKDGTEIRKRGFAEVVNRFGGNCFGCHIQALAVGSGVRNGPRLRSDSAYARHEWRFCKEPIPAARPRRSAPRMPKH